MRRVIPLLGFLFLCTIPAEPLFAQQRAFVFANLNILEVETSGPAFGRPIRLIPWSSTTAPQKVVPIAAGSLIAWAWGTGVQVIDVHSGSRQGYTFPGFSVQEILGTDESTFRVLLLGTLASVLPPLPPLPERMAVAIVDLHSGAVRTLELGDPRSITGVAHAAQPNVLFVGRRADPLNRIDVISVDSGVTVKSLTAASAPGVAAFVHSVTPSGARLFVSSSDGFGVVDTERNALVTRIPSSGIFGAPVMDESRNRLLFIELVTGQAFLSAFSLDTMEPLGRRELSTLGLPRLPLLDVSPQSATMLAVHPSVCSGCSPLTLAGLNADTGQLRAAANLPGLGTQIYDVDLALVRLTEPSAPRSVAANVGGSRLELTWTPSGALRYEVEAGSAPGLANLATVSVTDTRLTANDVPSGTYYLRVRAINAVGKSSASQEVQVVVP